MSLPAQTAVGMESSKAVTNVQLGYDCPVAITYKVAVFSLSGTVYDDNMKIQSFSTAGYRQSHFSTIFGSESEKGGTTAMDNLDIPRHQITSRHMDRLMDGQRNGLMEIRQIN